MSNIKTHTFNGTKYKINFVKSIEGVTNTKDIPKEPLDMDVLTGESFKAFHSVFHESLEASVFCDRCLHRLDGDSRTIDAARFIWRWLKMIGWRKE